MKKMIRIGDAYPSFVANMAAIDEFTAPDSIASRPNPGSLSDRPRSANQIPHTAVVADLKE